MMIVKRLCLTQANSVQLQLSNLQMVNMNMTSLYSQLLKVIKSTYAPLMLILSMNVQLKLDKCTKSTFHLRYNVTHEGLPSVYKESKKGLVI